MPITAKEPDGGDFTPAPAGHHLARCIRVIDLGTQFNPTFQTKSRQVLICFELSNTRMEDGNPFSVCKRYTVSLHKKSNLRRDLEAWRGRPFSGNELSGFDLEQVLGAYAYLILAHKTKGDRVFANINSISMVPHETPKPNGINPLVSFSLESFDRTTFDGLSDGLKKVIMDSEEMQHGQGHPPSQHQGPIETPAQNGDMPEAQQQTANGQDFDDDIPF
ncbi:MAG: phage replication initiation protein, NGO0469 family [Thiothrix sp.]